LDEKSAHATIGLKDVRTTLGDQGGAVNLKTILSYAAIALVIWVIVEQPGTAAHLFNNITSLLGRVADGVTNFTKSI
jgi:hypothetical protein